MYVLCPTCNRFWHLRPHTGMTDEKWRAKHHPDVPACDPVKEICYSCTKAAQSEPHPTMGYDTLEEKKMDRE